MEILGDLGRRWRHAIETAQDEHRMQGDRLEPAFQIVLDAILREKHGIASRRHDLATKPVDQLPIGATLE